MSDITINNNGSQNENQKTTPVTESSLELNSPSLSLPGDVFQIWLRRRVKLRTPPPLYSLSLTKLCGLSSGSLTT